MILGPLYHFRAGFCAEKCADFLENISSMMNSGQTGLNPGRLENQRKRGAILDEHKPPTRSHLFTVRLWVGQSEEAGPAWYGKVQDMVDGHTAYFCDWQALLTVLQSMLEPPATPPETPLPSSKQLPSQSGNTAGTGVSNTGQE